MRHGLKALGFLLLVLAPVQRAAATLVSFEVSGRVGCFFITQYECERFQADTGLSPPSDGSWDYDSRFTVDISSSPVTSTRHGNTYRIDQPGTGLAITVGNLSLFYFDFYVLLRDIGGSNDIFIRTSTDAIRGSSGLNLGSTGYVFSDYTLEELTRIPLSGFWYTPFDTWISDPQGRWLVQGNATRLQLVAEPGTLALLGLGLAVVGFARLRRLHATV